MGPKLQGMVRPTPQIVTHTIIAQCDTHTVMSTNLARTTSYSFLLPAIVRKDTTTGNFKSLALVALEELVFISGKTA